MLKTIILSLALAFMLGTYSEKAHAADWSADDLEGQFASWGISSEDKLPSINLLGAWQKFKQKKEVVVAVVDTGVDGSHPFLAANLYSYEGRTSPTNYGIDFTKKRKSKGEPEDQHGHGTHIAGIVKSVYPGVKILVLKYLDPHASEDDNLKASIEALRYAVDHNVDIINYSGGGPAPDDEERRVMKDAERKGILVVAAAGNEQNDIDNKKRGFYPASYGFSNVITVTAHDQSRRILNSSNYGKTTVDISAPGSRIRSSVPGGRAGYLTGTSQATAFVSGVAALIKSEFPNLHYSQVKKLIRDSAIKDPNVLDKCAAGRLDAAKAVELAQMVYGIDSKRDVASSKK